MKRNVGVWVDHRKAIIVRLTGEAEEIHSVVSGMEKHVRYSGGAQQDSAEDQRDNKFTGHLNASYDKIVSFIRDADSILIIGPGEAKIELKSRLEISGLGARVVGSEPADKMTDRQVAAIVRKHFLGVTK